MKRIFRGLLTAGLLAIAGHANAICTTKTTGLLLDIPNFGDNFSVWATCMRDDLIVLNDATASTTTLQIATATLQAQIDDLGVSTGALQIQVDALGVSTGAIESAKMNRTGSTALSTMTVAGNAFSVGVSTLSVSDGRVGINTANPENILHVVAVSTYAIKSSSGIIIEAGHLQLPDGSKLFTANLSGDFSDGGEAGGADRTLGNTDFFALGLLTNNLQRITFLGNGAVGVGITSPKALFQVRADDIFIDVNGRVGMNTGVTLDASLTVGPDAGSSVPELQLFDTVATAGSDAARIQFSAMNNSAVKRLYGEIDLEVERNINNEEAGDIVFKTIFDGSFDERMRLDAIGRLGIGTSSPEVPLHVVGDTTATGTAFVGSLKINDVPNCTDATGKLFTDVNGVVQCGTDAGAGAGDVFLNSTQTFSGINTFLGPTLFNLKFASANIADFFNTNTTDLGLGVTNSTIPLTTKGLCWMYAKVNGPAENDTVGHSWLIAVMMDGDFIGNGAARVGLLGSDETVANQSESASFSFLFPPPAAGDHNFYLSVASQIAGSTQLCETGVQSSDFDCQFFVGETTWCE